MSKTCEDCRYYGPPKDKKYTFHCSEPGREGGWVSIVPCSFGPYPKENDMNKELIEKLKHKDLAQPYCLLTKKEKRILKDAGYKNRLVLQVDGTFFSDAEGNKQNLDVYILKPDYEPEPEWIDIEIVEGGQWLKLKENQPGKPGNTWLLDCVANPRFVGFVSDSGWVRLEEIATRIHNGQKVIARFRRE